MIPFSMLLRLAVAIGLFCISIPLWFITSDREFSNLGPTDGAAYSIPLQANIDYGQTVLAARQSVTRLGLQLHTQVKTVPEGNLTITVVTPTEKRSVQLNPKLIEDEGFTEVRFEPPLKTIPGQPFTFHIVVPLSLQGAIRAQTRLPDDSFNANTVSFAINGVVQHAPLAHVLLYAYRPPFAWQLAGLLYLAIAALFWPRQRTRQHQIGKLLIAFYLPALALIPAFLFNHIPLVLYAALVIALSGMYLYLRRHLHWPAAFLGASLFAFTTWFPLHILNGRPYYFLAAFLPYLALYIERIFFVNKRWMGALCSVGIVTAAALLGTVIPHAIFPASNTSLSDTLLDPNQVPSSVKVGGNLAWDHFGAYVGPLAALLALVGCIAPVRRSWPIWIASLAALGLWYAGRLSVAATLFLIPLPHIALLLVFVLALWAALGLESIYRFLGQEDKLVQTVVGAMALFTMLDLWHIVAITLEYNFLS